MPLIIRDMMLIEKSSGQVRNPIGWCGLNGLRSKWSIICPAIEGACNIIFNEVLFVINELFARSIPA
jgi:hypothetical protein